MIIYFFWSNLVPKYATAWPQKYQKCIWHVPNTLGMMQRTLRCISKICWISLYCFIHLWFPVWLAASYSPFRMETPGRWAIAPLPLVLMATSQRYRLPVPQHNPSVLMDAKLSRSMMITDAVPAMNVNVGWKCNTFFNTFYNIDFYVQQRIMSVCKKFVLGFSLNLQMQSVCTQCRIYFSSSPWHSELLDWFSPVSVANMW